MLLAKACNIPHGGMISTSADIAPLPVPARRERSLAAESRTLEQGCAASATRHTATSVAAAKATSDGIFTRSRVKEPHQDMLSAQSRQVAEVELNEPPQDAQAPILAQFRARVAAAVGSDLATRLEWATLATLRQSKWDLDKAFERMTKLAQFASTNASYFECSLRSYFKGQACVGMISHLPTRTTKGELVLLIDGQKLREYARHYTMTDMLRYSVFYMAQLLQDEETQVHGAVILESLENYPIFALNSMKGMGASGMKASFDWLGAAPLRLRGLHACKQPWCVGV